MIVQRVVYALIHEHENVYNVTCMDTLEANSQLTRASRCTDFAAKEPLFARGRITTNRGNVPQRVG